MSSDTTLVLERRPGGLRLYLGGDLQFDTDDEAVYHERLAHPALLATRARFKRPLDLLVLGGGDGLLVRELLRHEGIGSVRLIDYNPDVLALAGTELAPWNGSSLADHRVVVEVADVREAIATAGSFHAIFSDLTCPGTLADCGLFTRDWFQELRAHLVPGGTLALNGLSPDQTPAAYWCVYQTLRSAGFATLPGRSRVPSFAELGYGDWGFFLGSDRAITSAELGSVAIPQGVRTLDGPGLIDCFEFPRQQSDSRTTIRPASDSGRTLYEYLLDATAIGPGEAGETDCFLGFDDPFPPPEPDTATVPSLKLKRWLDRQPGTGIDDLLMCVPLSHRIVTRELVMEWAGHLIQVASTLNLRRLTSALLRRASALPERLVAELKRFRSFLAQGEDPAANLTTWGWRFFSVLMLVLVLAQTAMPTAVYAKGFGGTVSSGGGTHSGGGFYSGGGAHYGGGTHYGGGIYPGGGSHIGVGTHPPGWSPPPPTGGRPMPTPTPPVQRRGGYVSGGAGTGYSPYYYYGSGTASSPYYYGSGTTPGTYYYAYSDAYYDYYYYYYNGSYYYYRRPRQG
jgi:spermidine synthase